MTEAALLLFLCGHTHVFSLLVFSTTWGIQDLMTLATQIGTPRGVWMLRRTVPFLAYDRAVSGRDADVRE